jgi:hypothetical protein
MEFDGVICMDGSNKTNNTYKTNKLRGQAAIEVLSTYAWGLMLLLIIIGLIAQLGLFNLGSFVPSGSDVSGFNTFAVSRYIFHSDGKFEIDFINTLDDQVTVQEVRVNDMAVSSASPAFPFNVSAGGNFTFSATSPLTGTASNGYTAHMLVRFDVLRGSANHLDSGTLRSVFQP